MVALWFYSKNLERYYGLRKYLSLITILGIYNGLVCFLIMTIGQLISNLLHYFVGLVFSALGSVTYQKTIFNEAIPGPLGILSGLYVCYGTFIPTSYNFKIVFRNPWKEVEPNELTSTITSKELTLTNHFPVHLLFNILFLNNGFKSIIPCLTGLLMGKLLINDLLPGSKTWLIPQFAFRLFVDPVKFAQNMVESIPSLRRTGYAAVPEVVEEDGDEELDGRNAIRAETPVRPLGSQFLDTFRN